MKTCSEAAASKDQTSGLLLYVPPPSTDNRLPRRNQSFIFQGNNVRFHLVIVSHYRRFSLDSLEYIRYCFSLISNLEFPFRGGVFLEIQVW